MRNSLFIIGIVALFSAEANSGEIPARIWVDHSLSLKEVFSQEIAAYPQTLVLANTLNDSDIVIQEKHQGGKYASILLREKTGRRDTIKIVAVDRKTGKTLYSYPQSPRPERNKESAVQMVREMAVSR